ncbi:MAG: Nif3-like dinuclear metal center hexameric protein [Planctomycetota bacterium]|jgi:putative NIF3 family GTP cyclohydrolase 1 type 2
MDRRQFVGSSLLAASSLYLNDKALAVQKNNPEGLAAGDVHNYLRSLGAGWVDSTRTVDTFKAGSPAIPVKGIAVGWMSYFSSLRRAVELDCNLFVTHEPTYYDHRDKDQSVFEFETARKKKEFIEEHNLSIIRCHDVWDQYLKLGIPDSWGSFLGFKNCVLTRNFYRVYELPAVKAIHLARHVAGKIANLGQQGVQLVGPADKTVSRVAIGTGAITPFRFMVKELKADVIIATDDGISYWRDAALAIDMDFPMIVVNHPCSEEFGMKNLAAHLSEEYPAVPVHHIPQKCMYKIINNNFQLD